MSSIREKIDVCTRRKIKLNERVSKPERDFQEGLESSHAHFVHSGKLSIMNNVLFINNGIGHTTFQFINKMVGTSKV